MELRIKELENERDTALDDLEFRRGLFQAQEQQLNDVRAQRDRLAEAALAVVDRWKAPYWDEVGQYHYIDALRKAVEEVKGGQP
jgi:hypothetical protein